MTKAAPLLPLLLTLLLLAACSSTPPAAPPSTPAPVPAPAPDPAFQALFPPNAAIEKLASGFQFIEGPVWLPGDRLLFSDIPANVVNQWSAEGNTVKEFLRPSENSNGLLAGPNNSLLLCQHSGRRIAMRSASGVITTLTDRFEGRKLNSPNDAVYHSDGSLYFTDPPYGLEKQDEDPGKELAFNGVYRLAKGKLQLLSKDLSRPNGIAFSPDEKFLYVANSDPARKLWMRYPVLPDGALGPGRVFADVTAEKADGLPDGLKVDEKGNLWATGPGGVWVFSPEGKHLGTLKPAEVPANLAFGGPDGKTLFLTARTGLYRIATAVAGKKAVY
jgi:gluconolactonase